ncbi:MAG: hypothetical protein KGJ23_08375 [Euryarchaeota archaeon]|nr:hypothetical protein [Euryarchaeota archaeon]MDE1836618.1 hypothetical protein [Euryarchaeota archaeon]MDE1879187.1 hypothetical protein [Euryarchaeota archaeon]MDE2044588.1 hypothetical protein [Thermoplasmata archaeon]
MPLLLRIINAARETHATNVAARKASTDKAVERGNVVADRTTEVVTRPLTRAGVR